MGESKVTELVVVRHGEPIGFGSFDPAHGPAVGAARSLDFGRAREFFRPGEPWEQDVMTDFDDLADPSGDFIIGAWPVTARFSGDAFAGASAIRELYQSFPQAWLVNLAGTGLIQFETNAVLIEFYARTRSLATQSTVITAFDDMGQVIDSVVLEAPDPFQLVTFAFSVDHIEVANKRYDPYHLDR